MEIFIRLLFFCTVISVTNLFGMYPPIDDFEKWKREADILTKSLAAIYAIVVLIGYLNIVGWIFYLIVLR